MENQHREVKKKTFGNTCNKQPILHRILEKMYYLSPDDEHIFSGILCRGYNFFILKNDEKENFVEKTMYKMQ